MIGVITLMTTVVVAVILFRISQQGEEERAELTKSNFEISAYLSRNMTSGVWQLLITLVNEGPASSEPLRIDLHSGGLGITPTDLSASIGDFIGGSFGGYAQNLETGRKCYTSVGVIRVADLLFPGDDIDLIQTFRVDPWREPDLISDPKFTLGRSVSLNSEGSTESEVLYLRWNSGSPETTLLGAFVRSLTIKGSNVDLAQSWAHDHPYDHRPC